MPRFSKPSQLIIGNILRSVVTAYNPPPPPVHSLLLRYLITVGTWAWRARSAYRDWWRDVTQHSDCGYELLHADPGLPCCAVCRACPNACTAATSSCARSAPPLPTQNWTSRTTQSPNSHLEHSSVAFCGSVRKNKVVRTATWIHSQLTKSLD